MMAKQNPSTQSATDRLLQAFADNAPPDWPVARAAILAGAPVDAPIPSWSGATPLFIAATCGCTTEVGWLIDHGATLEVRNSNGETALVQAVRWCRTTTVALLLARGADPNARDQDGWTVLMAVGSIRSESAKNLIVALLDHGANPSATTPDGHTAPEILMEIAGPMLTGYLDEALAGDRHTIGRRRLLDKLTAAQRAAWFPRSCAAEAAAAVRTAWHRTP